MDQQVTVPPGHPFTDPVAWSQLVDVTITSREVHLEQLQLFVTGALRHPALVSKDCAFCMLGTGTPALRAPRLLLAAPRVGAAPRPRAPLLLLLLLLLTHCSPPPLHAPLPFRPLTQRCSPTLRASGARAF